MFVCVVVVVCLAFFSVVVVCLALLLLFFFCVFGFVVRCSKNARKHAFVDD